MSELNKHLESLKLWIHNAEICEQTKDKAFFSLKTCLEAIKSEVSIIETYVSKQT